MRNKFRNFIDATLNTDVTPLGYLVTLHSLIFGASFVFFGDANSVKVTLLFKLGALVGVPVWGTILFVGAVALILGLAMRNMTLTNMGSAAGFMAWLFAAIVYFLNDFWLQAILAVIIMLEFGYFNISASIGRLWNYSP
jgi:hypothetical protein